jgi:MFS family permease
MQQDFREMLRSRPVLFVVVLVCTPVGIGAASRLWSAVAPDWSATPDTVALVTGVLSALVSAVGSVTGGAIAVRFGRWWAFFGAGALMALVALVMAASPRTPGVYVVGVLFYSFTLGLATAGFLSVVLHAIGRGAASTKFSIFWSLGNVPTVYMIAFNGWMHDHFGAPGMLAGEALLALSFIVLAVTALWKLSSRAPIPDRAGA